MSPIVPIGAAAVLVVAIALSASRARRRFRGRIRDAWARPIDRDRDLGAIAGWHRWRARESPGAEWLDDRTWADLHLDEVFATLDRCVSTVGQQALYDRLRRTPTPDDAERFEALAGRFGADLAAREAAGFLFARLDRPAGYGLWRLALPGATALEPWYALVPVLTGTTVAALLAVPFWPPAILVLIAGLVTSMVVHAVIRWKLNWLLPSFRHLGVFLTVAKRLHALGASAGLDTGIQPGDLAAVSRLHRVVRRASPDPVAVGGIPAMLFEYLNLLLLLDTNVLFFAGRQLERRGPELLGLLHACGTVDAARSVASLRAGSERWTRPVFHAGGEVRISDMRHPLLDDAVPNPLEVGAERGLIVTGSNMSGKSTYLRTAGLTVIMAQSLNTCLAAGYEAPRLRVRSAIGRSDDLIAGTSYYLAEVEAVLDLVRTAATGRPHLLLFDELFRGTNAVERIAAGSAVLASLAAVPAGADPCPHVVLVATHDGELVELLEGSYAAVHFEEQVTPEGLTFDYRLRPGPARTRNAIALLEQRGAPADLVRLARERAAAIEAERSLAGSLAARRRQ